MINDERKTAVDLQMWSPQAGWSQHEGIYKMYACSCVMEVAIGCSFLKRGWGYDFTVCCSPESPGMEGKNSGVWFGLYHNLPASLRRLLHLHVEFFTLHFSGHLPHRVLVRIQGAKRAYRCFEELKTFLSGQGLFMSLVKSISSVSASSINEPVHSWILALI